MKVPVSVFVSLLIASIFIPHAFSIHHIAKRDRLEPFDPSNKVETKLSEIVRPKADRTSAGLEPDPISAHPKAAHPKPDQPKAAHPKPDQPKAAHPKPEQPKRTQRDSTHPGQDTYVQSQTNEAHPGQDRHSQAQTSQAHPGQDHHIQAQTNEAHPGQDRHIQVQTDQAQTGQAHPGQVSGQAHPGQSHLDSDDSAEPKEIETPRRRAFGSHRKTEVNM